MKKLLSFIFEVVKTAILVSAIVIPIRYFLFQPFLVRGSSMVPNFENGDYLLVDEISYRFGEPQRGEVIVFEAPDNSSSRYIKRIIGLPGETVEIKEGRISISKDGESWILDESNYFEEPIFTAGNVYVSLQENEYFVLGDNRQFSSDSRRWGPLAREDIIGRALFRAWPFDVLAKVGTPAY